MMAVYEKYLKEGNDREALNAVVGFFKSLTGKEYTANMRSLDCRGSDVYYFSVSWHVFYSAGGSVAQAPSQIWGEVIKKSPEIGGMLFEAASNLYDKYVQNGEIARAPKIALHWALDDSLVHNAVTALVNDEVASGVLKCAAIHAKLADRYKEMRQIEHDAAVSACIAESKTGGNYKEIREIAMRHNLAPDVVSNIINASENPKLIKMERKDANKRNK